MIKERVEYPYQLAWAKLFNHATQEALRLYEEHPNDRAMEALGYLEGCEYPGLTAAVREGASYKSLAYVAHLLELSVTNRTNFYEVARCVPLSQAHVGYIIARLRERDRMLSGLEEMLLESA